MMRPVLAGVDGSAQSDAAVLWAAEEAVRRRVPLRLVHAWPWLANTGSDRLRHGEDLRTAALHMLATTEGQVRRDHPGLEVETTLVGDEAVDGLLSAAEDGGLLVLGSRGLGGFAGLLVGSVGLATAARADLPVVLVRAGQGAGPAAQESPEIVLGLDARSPVDQVLAFAFEEAALRGARVRAVHGWDLPPAWSYSGWAPGQVDATSLQVDAVELRDYEAKLLTDALSDWREKYPGVEVEEHVRAGGAAGALVDASAGAQLVVVGRRVRPHGIGARLGGVAHAVIHHSQAPTAVVPHP